MNLPRFFGSQQGGDPVRRERRNHVACLLRQLDAGGPPVGLVQRILQRVREELRAEPASVAVAIASQAARTNGTVALRFRPAFHPHDAHPHAMTPAQTMNTSVARTKLVAAREAFRHQQLAGRLARRCSHYIEHNLFEEARRCRTQMLDNLRGACRQWRTVLGLAP